MTNFQTQNIRDFAQLRRELEVCYFSKKSTTHLQLEFNTLKQKPARAFGLHTDKLVMELYESMTEGQQSKTDAKRVSSILEIIQQQALYNFQLGLQDDIKLLLRAQHYMTLQDAIAGASAEEKFKGPTGNFEHPKASISQSPTRENRLPQCHKCGKTGHYGRTKIYLILPTAARQATAYKYNE
ncbi:hypothetical protein P5V15_011722 [Pogonomyrmex californicus]